MLLTIFDIARFLIGRPLWWIILRLRKVDVVGGITFVDMQSGGDPVGSTAVCKLLEAAVHEIKAAGQIFSRAVEDNVKFVVRTGVNRPAASYLHRAYNSASLPGDRNDTRLMALELVWTAKFFETLDSGSIWTYRARLEAADWQARQFREWFRRHLGPVENRQTATDTPSADFRR